LLDNHVPSSWNQRQLADITGEDVIRLRDRIKQSEGADTQRKRGGPYAANHLIRLLRAMFKLAKTRGICPEKIRRSESNY
jgi:hypothetical protein